ncbi:uncharacterized protein LOC120276139 [Dioscorea cayenensis subsp. rotundata]|uniref:Uncharacterized protein LOC120276139 n=1 Tax=Dioscorea cayennensis subsp. rotundata TaxID=55577 RepID=A0AB40CHA9_DIOCR|nr:uncharacterized protein LOC120276139 [Dioscorea cayenensis subsp. rotundata]
MAKKMKDPRSFTIPCMIGELVNEKALAYLGASINVMPFTMYKKLGFSDLKPTLQLADRSIRHPRDIIEDVLVKVNKFIFPMDFVILDVDEDVDAQPILGRLLLTISQALIDASNGKMILRIGDNDVIFALSDAM